MATITIEIPDEVMSALQRTATTRGRDIADEARDWLKVAARTEDKVANQELLERIRRTRAKLASAGLWLTEEDIRAACDESRR